MVRLETSTAYLLLGVVVLRLRLSSCSGVSRRGDENVEGGNVIDMG
jgi:hypothetical protein